MKLFAALGRVVNGIIGKFGLEIHPVYSPTNELYYPMPKTCQIPNLSTILEETLGKRNDGFFVEVGAYDGYTFSNTWGLAERGWGGIMFEPVPEFAAAARLAHADHQGVKIVECAIGDSDDQTLTLTLGGAITSASEKQVSEYRSVRWAHRAISEQNICVESTTLDRALQRSNAPRGFDVLVVDVEGLEEAVLNGFSIGHWEPRILIVELTDLHPDLTVNRESHRNLRMRIIDHGYEILYKDASNTVFVKKDLVNRG